MITEKSDAKKNRRKLILSIIFSLLFLIFLGAALTFLILALFFQIEINNWGWERWTFFAGLFAIGFCFANYRLIQSNVKGMNEFTISDNHTEVDVLKNDLQELRKANFQFFEEIKKALKGHLKVSILFWVHYYKKEKVRSLEDTKKEVFRDLNREFHQVHWMSDLLEEIKNELNKYKL